MPTTRTTGAPLAAPPAAQWLAQIYSSTYSAAKLITSTSEALRTLPALDHKLSTGELTLDQVAAASEFATPETDAQLAREAIGKAPGQITRAARMLAPPTLVDDAALYRRRALRLAWTGDGRELRSSGSLPLERGVAFEQAIRAIAKPLRAADKPHPRQRHGEHPVLTDQSGRAITANQRHAPPR